MGDIYVGSTVASQQEGPGLGPWTRGPFCVEFACFVHGPGFPQSKEMENGWY